MAVMVVTVVCNSSRSFASLWMTSGVHEGTDPLFGSREAATLPLERSAVSQRHRLQRHERYFVIQSEAKDLLLQRWRKQQPPRTQINGHPLSIPHTPIRPTYRKLHPFNERGPQMRFMVIVKATAESERPGSLPDPKGTAEMNKCIDEMMAAGVLVGYDGLHPSAKGARVHFSGANRTVTDGPFAETKELIAGFMILRVNSLEEAIGWVKRMPCCSVTGEGEVEIRQVFEPEDFARDFNEADIEQERQIRAQLAVQE